jgi:hypothetical protein
VRRASAVAILVALACGDDRGDQISVEVLRVAPAQLLNDSLEVAPGLDTVQNTPEQGQVALSLEIRVRNSGGTTRYVPPIGFRTVAENTRDTVGRWRFDITRRTVDSLPPGQSATFGLTTSAASLATGGPISGVYRVEAVIGDSTSGRRMLPLGRIRLRSAADSL